MRGSRLPPMTGRGEIIQRGRENPPRERGNTINSN
jgi:hypothetical protein